MHRGLPLDDPRPRLPIRRPAAYAGAVEPAVSALYAELRSLAHGMMRRERGGHTLQTTGLVHEAWMRLGQDGQWDSRHHFLGAAAHAMRRILVEYARANRKLRSTGRSDTPHATAISWCDLPAKKLSLIHI